MKLSSGDVVAQFRLPDQATLLTSAKSESEGRSFDALRNPSGLPPVSQCVVPGDRVTIAVDPDTPEVNALITEVWQQLQGLDLDLNVTLMFPSDSSGDRWKVLIDDLPVHVRNQLSVHVHDPADEQQRNYLASSAGGERIYLSQHLIDADLIIIIGAICFDPFLGVRGTHHALYPMFSDQKSIQADRKTRTAATDSSQSEPIHQLVAEVGWLLGTQFAVQAVAAADGSIRRLFCGAVDRVAAEGKQFLTEQWQFKVPAPAELAIIHLPKATSGYEWKHLGQALSAVNEIVEEDGRVAVVASLSNPVGSAIQMLRNCDEPKNLLKSLMRGTLDDAVETAQLIQALQHCRIYLLSDLPDNTVEDLGILPLASDKELQRLIDSAEHVVVVPAANYASLHVAEPVARQ